MALSIGDQAPDFTLYSSDKQPVQLSSLRGKPVTLLFFPFAFTSVCTTELCSVRDNLASYSAAGSQVFGISVDSPFTLDKFKADNGINFPLLSDFNKEVSRAYGALYEHFVFDLHGVSKRAAFVIDPQGKIAHAEVLENAGELPNLEAVKAAVATLS